MKALSFSSLILSVLGLVTALVNQFHFKPQAESLRKLSDTVDLNDPAYVQSAQAWTDALDLQILLGEIALIAGGIAFLLALAPIFKGKSKLLPIIALVIALVSVFLGLAQGTHMFS